MFFTKFFFKLILKVSTFHLEKQKSFIPKEKDLSRCHYQNKKALFTDPIFSEGFVQEEMEEVERVICLLLNLSQKKCY